jgi:hypothetical protein
MVRFTVGSFLFFLKLDQRRNVSILPAECWMHRRTGGALFDAPVEMFEEGCMYRSLGSSLPVRGFFDKMRSRRSERA